MMDKVLWAFIITDFLFLLSGGLLIGFALVSDNDAQSTPTVDDIARSLLLADCPLTASIVNAVFVFVAFLLSIPALVMPTSRGWLKLHGYLVVFCALFTLILGLVIWFGTLTTRNELGITWATQTSDSQSLLQQELSCCGYLNSTSPPFVQDSFCTSASFAAMQVGCVGPFSSLANNFLDLVFTAAFGIVGIDVALILAVAMLLKDRKEKERYKHIDEKHGMGGF